MRRRAYIVTAISIVLAVGSVYALTARNVGPTIDSGKRTPLEARVSEAGAGVGLGNPGAAANPQGTGSDLDVLSSTTADIYVRGETNAQLLLDKNDPSHWNSINFRHHAGGAYDEWIMGTGIYAGGTDFVIGNNTAAKVTMLASNFNVGIGTTSPQAKLDVATGGIAVRGTNYTTGGAALELNTVDLGGGSYLGQVASVVGSTRAVNPLGIWGSPITMYGTGATGSPIMTLLASGNVGIGTTSPSSKLHVGGSVVVDGNIAAKYQDVAEWVDAAEPIPPGTVVSIREFGTNVVEPSSRAYDTTVAGVVSEQPGIVLGEKGPGRVLAAQSGRVRVKVDASYGAIAAGDLLVTSPTAGLAMRSVPVDVNGVSFHRPGTILGKALEALPSGQGEILALLTLQ